MSDLRELYQEQILDHSKKPRNSGSLSPSTHVAEGHNPLCGDQVTIYLDVRDGRIDRARFQGSGCAISVASASMMTEALEGATIERVEETFRVFHELVTGRREAVPEDRLGKLIAFTGVRGFPVRVKCATLPWHTLLAALANKDETVSTE